MEKQQSIQVFPMYVKKSMIERYKYLYNLEGIREKKRLSHGKRRKKHGNE